MSELKDYDIMDIEAMDDERLEKSESGRIQVTRVYIKSEVDKVIDELKAKLKVQTSNAEEAWKLKDSYHTDYSEAVEELFKKNKQLRHNKYKRCLSMADFCESQHHYYNTLGNGFWLVRGDKEKRDEYRKKASDFWWKYHKRWLELADKFKEEA